MNELGKLNSLGRLLIGAPAKSRQASNSVASTLVFLASAASSSFKLSLFACLFAVCRRRRRAKTSERKAAKLCVFAQTDQNSNFGAAQLPGDIKQCPRPTSSRCCRRRQLETKLSLARQDQRRRRCLDR